MDGGRSADEGGVVSVGCSRRGRGVWAQAAGIRFGRTALLREDTPRAALVRCALLCKDTRIRCIRFVSGSLVVFSVLRWCGGDNAEEIFSD